MIACCSTHKRLGIGWEIKLSSYNWKNAKANKGIGVIKKLHVISHRALLTIYKCFTRPNLDYGDFTYNQPNNDSFCSKIESIQYALTGAIQGTSQTKLSTELGLESPQWFRYLCTLHKIKTTGRPPYLNMLTKVTHHYQTQNSEDLAIYQTRANIFKYYFFPI